MSILAYIILFVYTLALIYITGYCLIQFHLLFYYKRYHRNVQQPVEEVQDKNEDLPFVTVQLPIFNEMYVVERLIDNIVLFDY